METIKFKVYDFSGKVCHRFIAQEKTPCIVNHDFDKKHHIIAVDRSGSMKGCIEELKSSLKKILALHEYTDESIIVSLISYSSKGDFTVHFKEKPVKSIDLSIIDELKTANSTCISQVMECINDMIDENYKTGVTLHSDGFANDPSSFYEKKRILEICDELAKSNVFINTIAHSEYADFQLLSSIANKVSGSCIQANNFKQLYDSIINTFDMLKKERSCSLNIKKNDDEYLLYISKDDSRIIGGSTDLNIVGIDSKNPGLIYGFKELDEKQYDLAPCQEIQTCPLIFCFAKAKLIDGNINIAKYILSSTGDLDTLDKYWNASTSLELSKLALILEDYGLLRKNIDFKFTNPSIVNDSVTVIDVMNVFDKYKGAFTLDLSPFLYDYNRVGVHRVRGERDSEGRLIEPWLDIDYLGDKNIAEIIGVDFSMTSPNISINTVQKCRLIKKSDNSPITKVAGLMVDSLKLFHSYSIVSNGDINVDMIPVFISNKNAWDEMVDLGVLFEDNNKVSKSVVILPDGRIGKSQFKFDKKYWIMIGNLPITKLSLYSSLSSEDIGHSIENLFICKILCGFFDAILKTESDSLTDKQISELKNYYLTKNLNINFPTTTPYDNLEEAVSSGDLDVCNSFKVKFGTKGIFGLDSFRSSNELIQKMYQPKGWNKVDKYDCTKILESIQWEEKDFSRFKITSADFFQKRILDAFLLGKNVADVNEILAESKSELLSHTMLRSNKFNSQDKEYLVKSLIEARDAVKKYSYNIYMNRIAHILFYVGSFAMAPDEWNAELLSYEELKDQWPDAKVTKNDGEGLFFKYGNVIFGLTSEKRYISRKVI